MHEKQNKILHEVLKLVPFDGWGTATLRHAANNCGLDENYAQIAFPNGSIDAIKLFLKRIEDETFAKIDLVKLKEMKIRERIFTIISARFEIMEEYKSIMRITIQYLAMPQNICHSIKLLWQMADVAWYAAGDNSSDFNHYTKRAILIGVYSSTMLFWLEDSSKKHIETSGFLKRRIENVMQLQGRRSPTAS